MKPVAFVLLLLVLGASLQVSCGGSNPSGPGPTGTPVATPTRTATPPGVTFSVNGTSYSTTGPSGSPISATTITSGDPAVWDNTVTGSNHTLLISGTNLTTCSQTYPNGNGAITLNLSTGTYQFHCGVHASCSVDNCGNCGGMAATLVVQ